MLQYSLRKLYVCCCFVFGHGVSGIRDTVPAKISCFYDYGQERALRLGYYIKIGRIHRQKEIEVIKFE